MRRVGLTGGIGSGKSEVGRLLATLGAVVVDADEVARAVVAPGTAGLDQVVRAFGPDVLDAAGALDRPGLAALVFADPAARRRLEQITHPLIGAEIVRRAAGLAGDAVLVVEVPLLVEAGLRAGYDAVVLVEAPLPVRLSRLAARGMTREQALERIASQAGDEERRAAADIVVDNSGDLEHLRAAVAEAWPRIAGRSAGAGDRPSPQGRSE